MLRGGMIEMKKLLSLFALLILIVTGIILVAPLAYANGPVFDHIIIDPASETNELSEDNTHSITVTAYDTLNDPLPGVQVSFSVGGANAGVVGTCDPADGITDLNGEVTFTYYVTQELSSLGTDSITVTASGITGTVYKEWVDTIPPQVSYGQGINPGGIIVPKAFYQLNATDGIDPNPQIFVEDTGTGSVFGPFSSDANIKYIVAKGAIPSLTYIGPSSIPFITGQGPAQIYAVDASGNVSDPVSIE